MIGFVSIFFRFMCLDIYVWVSVQFCLGLPGVLLPCKKRKKHYIDTTYSSLWFDYYLPFDSTNDTFEKTFAFFVGHKKEEETRDWYIHNGKLSLWVWLYVLLIPPMTYLPGFALQGPAALETWLGHIRVSNKDNNFSFLCSVRILSSVHLCYFHQCFSSSKFARF